MDAARSAPNLRETGICDLPYDILFELVHYLAAQDMTYLLSTCRTLHKYLHEISLWQHFSARYGLRDLSHFHGLSFYTVYTQLLHAYAPLCGFWASDHPYRGNIMEFRLTVDEDYAGIVGESWVFPDSSSPDTRLLRPQYMPVVTIGFQPPPRCMADKGSNGSGTVSVYCDLAHPSNADIDSCHLSRIEVLSSTQDGYFMQNYRRSFPHPDFPWEGASWYEGERGMPRLKVSTPVSVDQHELVRIYPAVRLPLVFSTPTKHLKPPAISITCPHKDFRGSFEPPIPFEDLTPAPPRYYPLKCEIRIGIDPESDEWKPESLVGLWIGDYGPNGLEVLYLSWHPDAMEVHAHKITGDIHVPRGVCSWKLQVSSEGVVHLGFDIPARRVFAGAGTVSDRGYPRPEHLPVLIGVVGPDKISVWWGPLNHFQSYVRYKGREDA